ncbi:MAG TPA: amino acid permease [Gemmatimonadaceae bacterium]|nr:amino acid permease [Gemmatimonadaceae bacterium]
MDSDFDGASSATTDSAFARASSLPRRLGLWSAVAVLVGSTIGSGIFRSPASIADKLPGPLPLLAIWLTGGVFALCGALTLAEIAGALPRTGGVYVFIREAWGRLPAFLFGWAELVLIRAAALGAISTTFSEYFIRVLGYDPRVPPYSAYVHYVAAVAILLTATFNYVGIKWGSLVQNVTTLAKTGAVILIIVLAIAIGLPRTGGHFTPAVPAGSFTLAHFGLALVSVLWVYDGWADVSFVGGEVKDPQKNLPRVLIFGTLIIIALYLLANVAYLAVLPVEEIRHSKLVAADVAERLMGATGVAFVAAAVMVSTFGTLNGSVMTGSRILFAMAADGLLFKPIARVHKKFRTPGVAIWLEAGLGVVFVLLGTFEQLADTFVTAIVPFYALAVAAIFVFRRRQGYQPPFRVPGYPVVPAIFIVATILLLGNAIVDSSSRIPTLVVLGVILLGIPVYYATRSRSEVF